MRAKHDGSSASGGNEVYSLEGCNSVRDGNSSLHNMSLRRSFGRCSIAIVWQRVSRWREATALIPIGRSLHEQRHDATESRATTGDFHHKDRGACAV